MSAVADAIKKVATGPHLSKDLSLEESREAMREILSGQVDPVRMAVLLIALRMKPWIAVSYSGSDGPTRTCS